MIDVRDYADKLLEDFKKCSMARPKHNAVNIQLEKDSCAKWAGHLKHQMVGGDDIQIAEACYQLESRLKPLKEKLVIEVLKHGSV